MTIISISTNKISLFSEGIDEKLDSSFRTSRNIMVYCHQFHSRIPNQHIPSSSSQLANLVDTDFFKCTVRILKSEITCYKKSTCLLFY